MVNQPIAIVGIATELPSGDHTPNNLGHDEFFKFIMEKKDAYVRIPQDRLNINAWAGRGLGQIIAERGSFLKDIGMFDSTEFGITAKDARAMAVSTRKLIELSFLALLDAGIDYRGKNIGCYASATAFDMQSIAEPDEMEARGSLAGIPCMVANKISYHLDLRGPSIPVDTACSSSAVALHLAVQAIRSGECEAAVVAGCQINLRASDFPVYTQASILSPDGKCKPFDAGGNGFSRGEGAAVAILKPLEQAIKDGDHIYGTVLGTGVSSCGSLAPVNAPVAEAQADAMERAYKGTGRFPSEVDFVECHGTGTAAGDPAEANWVGKRFARPGELLISSVKGNIGHLEITSFLASMSKVCSVFEHKIVPPQANLRKLNPAIHWDEYKLRVPVGPEPIAARASSRNILVSICSSGIGGVNAHAVLESFSRAERPAPSIGGATLLIAGGLSPRSASAIGDDIKHITTGLADDKVADYATVYGRRARQMTWRSFAVKRPGQDIASFSQPALAPRVKPPVLFLFSGQGPQHLHMGRQLFEAYPVFRQSIMEMDVCYKRRTGVSMVDDIGLFGPTIGQGLPSVWPISLILPSITAVQLALFDLLVSVGVRPDMLIGHSAGETSLLYASGAGSKEMALEISIARGEAMTIVEEHSEGTMAAIACSAEDANRILQAVSSKHPEKTVEIACYNSPDAVALAGHTILIDEAVALANKEGFVGRKIMTRVPVHGSLMELCKSKFEELVSDVFARYPGEHRTKVATYSTCTGQLLDAFTADYFWSNSRNAVLFETTMGGLLATHPNPLVVEMSPHPVLASYTAEIGVAPSSIAAPMRRSKTITPFMEQTSLLTAIGQLVAAGYSQVDFHALNGLPEGTPVPRMATPPYPFAKKHVEYFPELSRIMYRQMSSKAGPLNFPELRVNVATHPELAEHLINSEPIMPAAGFIEMGLECGAKTMWNIKFHSILALSASSPVPVNVNVEGMRYSVRSQPLSGAKYFNHDTKSSRLHADGYFSRDMAPRPVDLDVQKIMHRCTAFDVKSFYHILEYFAQYGPSFRRVDEAFFGNREALVRLKGMGGDLARDGNYTLHPAVLDASFHACVHPLMTKSTDPNVYYLPAGVNVINVFDAMDRQALCAKHVYAYVQLKAWDPSQIVYDVALLDMRGQYLCALDGFSVARHYQIPVQEISTRYELVTQPYNVPAEPPISSKSSDSGIALDDNVETLETRCREVLQYVVGTCGKKVIQMLEVALGSEVQPLGKQLVDMAGGLGAALPGYTIACEDVMAIPPGCRPPQYASLKLDPSKPDSLSTLNPAAFDLVVASLANVSDMNTEAILAQLRPLLVPGTFLLLKAQFSSDWQPLLNRAAFDQVIIWNEDQKPRDVLIQARCPPLPSSLPTAYLAADCPLIVQYAVGEEMRVQQELQHIDDSFDSSIWLTASEGVDADGLTGFGRTLIKEFPQWNVRIASFSNVYSEEDRQFIITSYLPQAGEEREFVIEEELRILCPRIVPMAPPDAAKDSLSVHKEPLQEHELRVEVQYSSPSDTGLWGVVGKVIEARGSAHSYLVGRDVVAVTADAPTSVVCLHRSAVVRLPSRVDRAAMATSVPALFFGGLTLGPGALKNPKRLQSKVVITHKEDRTAQVLSALCHMLDLSVTTLSSKPSPQDLYALKLQSADIVFSAFEEKSQVFAGCIPPDTCVASWRSAKSTHNAIRRDPWAVHDILNAVTKLPNMASILGSSSEPTSELTTMAPTKPRLFSPDKSYLLVGGMGSLGPSIALWMYQRGARHVVLTSRSGKATLTKMADLAPSLVFDYLESLPDFSLVVEAADATDAKGMAGVLDHMVTPLGGCVFLSTAFDDRLFYYQDKESFSRSYCAKVGAVETMESLIDLSALDFVIGMSTATTWGNAGQANYTSANTIMEGKLRHYRNAFCIAAPAIFNTTSMTGTISTSNAERASHLMSWAISPEELCNCLEDGLRKLGEQPFGTYVPALDFDVVTESLGPSHLYSYMTRGHEQQGTTVDGQDLHDILQSLVLQVVDVAADDFSPEVPLTTYGLDSLTAGRLSSALRPWVTLSQMQLLGDMTFATLEAHVAKAQQSKVEDGAASASNADAAAGAAELERMVKKYSIGFDPDAKRPTGSLLPDAIVLITGTTGSLGSYFLAQLLADDRVSHVYAFNRPSESSIVERQMAGFKARELDVSLLSSPKLVYVEGDAASGQLGLAKEMYEKIRKEVTIIIHNAWRLDLNAPLKTFVPNIAGTRNLLDLARASPRTDNVRFAFISTIGTTQNWRDLSKPAPEEIVEDASLAAMRGYGEGKYVAEKIVAASGIQSSVFRVGQLSGADDTGAWSVTEWIPSIIKSSFQLGTLPDAGGVISWLPMNKTAPVVLDAVFSTNSPPAVLNVVHPRPVTWHTMMSNLAASLSDATSSRKFKLVPFLDWITQLEKLSLTLSIEEAKDVPALKLLDRLRIYAEACPPLSPDFTETELRESGGWARLSIDKILAFSSTLRALDSPEGTIGSEEQARRFVQYWFQQGLLSLA